MKPSGDIPKEHQVWASELSKAEKLVDGDSTYEKERKAQIYVCLAHDWYQMDSDEEGNRLLLKAEKICPGYFKGPVIEHTQEDPSFDFLIKNLTVELFYLLTETMRNR